MVVSSPISGAGNARPTAGHLPPGTNAPSVMLPLTFMLTGIAGLSFGMVWLVANPAILAIYHYNQNVVAATHLFVLGWICSVVMGAMYQLVPVALETKLYSQRLARWHYFFHVIGFVGMVWMFRVWNMKQVGHFGSVFAVGVGMFVYNMARTLARAPKWNVVASAIASALFWILFAAIAGLSIAAGKCVYESADALSPGSPIGALARGLRRVGVFMSHFDPMSAMHAHAHLGAVGFFTMLIVGVSYKLVPMFTISEIQSRRRALASLLLLNAGLAGSFTAILLRSPWKPVFALMVLAGLAVYGGELVAIIRTRKRRPLDGGITCFLTAIALLGPVSLIALILSWPDLPFNSFTLQLENAYGFLGLLGFVTLAIIGMLYKIVPFLVWFGCYSRRIGRGRVPALAEMYSPRWQAAGYWLHLAGLTVTTPAILAANVTGIRYGCGLLVLSAVTLAANTGSILTHFFKARATPLALPPSTIPKTA